MRVEIDSAALTKIGFRIVSIIRARTLSGIDSEGNEFKPYGTSAFARPAGGIPKKVFKALGKDAVTFYKKEGKATWVVIEGGYVKYKAALRPNDGGTVNLTDTNAMLGALRPQVNGKIITIGFTRAEEAQKAYWHNESGAGKSRVIRRFLGLTEAEFNDEQIIRALEAGIKISE